MNLKNALLTRTSARLENLTGPCKSGKATGNMLTDVCFVPKEKKQQTWKKEAKLCKRREVASLCLSMV